MSAATLSVVVMMLMLFLKHLLLQGYRMLHNLYQFLTVKILNRSRDDSSILIQATEKLQRLLNLFSLAISVRLMMMAPAYWIWLSKNSPKFFIYILHFCINNSCIAVQFNVNLVLNTLYSLDNVRKLTNSWWLDQDPVGLYLVTTSFRDVPKSPTREQQIQPEFISLISIPASFKNPPSIPISPNSFSINTTCCPLNASCNSFLIRSFYLHPKTGNNINLYHNNFYISFIHFFHPADDILPRLYNLILIL